MPMTRLEQETYEVLEHCIPRIADALERIARALDQMEKHYGDNTQKSRAD